MIFVTVGTHEQPFNRLVKYIDDLKGNGFITEEVIIQTGYSTYEPKFCKWSKLFSYQEMQANVAIARIVITHGGPSSFIMPLQVGKVPIVVARRKQYDEHVNDHQVEFCEAVAQRQGNIIVVKEVEELDNLISNYENIVLSMTNGLKSNNEKFVEEFEKIVNKLFAGKKGEEE